MSGTGGFAVGPVPSSERIDQIQEEMRQEDEAAEFETELNELLRDVLAEANQRDVALLQTHLDEVRDALEDLLEDTVDLRFGGSVSKHTYVDGISDADLLVLVKRDVAEGVSPKELIREFGRAIQDRMPYADVKTGDLSIKIVTDDGMAVQLLPAYKTPNGYRIARPMGETWSNVINPKVFAAELTAVNQANGNKVVPVVKLLKIAQLRLPERSRLQSYHIESLAVDAFRNYDGPLDHKSMFLQLAHHAASRTQSPMEEKTGQSAYLDRYLGARGSPERMRAAEHARRLAARLDNASKRTDIDAWREAFEIGEY